MQAWLIDSLDGIGQARLTDVSDPTPGEGEVLLRIKLAGLNPADYYLAAGQYPAKPPLPHVLGRDGFGTVDAVGGGVGDVAVGDEMVILRGATGVERFGTFAGKVVVAADQLVPKPSGWTDEEAAGASLVYLTAWQALRQFGEVKAGETLLVTGASGGVGSACVQLGRAMGLRVVALSRSGEKRATLEGMGADVTLDPNGPDLGKRIIDALGGRVDLAVDNVAGEDFNELLAAMNMNGRISCVGMLAGPVPRFNTAGLFFRRLTIRGVAVGTFETQEAREAWRRIVAMLDDAGVRPPVDEVFAFDRLPDAFSRLKEGPMGKVLLRVSD